MHKHPSHQAPHRQRMPENIGDVEQCEPHEVLSQLNAEQRRAVAKALFADTDQF